MWGVLWPTALQRPWTVFSYENHQKAGCLRCCEEHPLFQDHFSPELVYRPLSCFAPVFWCSGVLQKPHLHLFDSLTGNTPSLLSAQRRLKAAIPEEELRERIARRRELSKTWSHSGPRVPLSGGHVTSNKKLGTKCIATSKCIATT